MNVKPIGARPAGCMQRAGPARRRRAEKGGIYFFCVAIVGSALVRTRTAGSSTLRCVNHGDCQAGFFCALSVVDSYEGWLHEASFCRPCSQCRCNQDASTAKCPTDRFACLRRACMQGLGGLSWQVACLWHRAEFAVTCLWRRCPGAPSRMLRAFEGTFASVTSLGKYGGDLCVTFLTGPLQEAKSCCMFSTVWENKMQGLHAPRQNWVLAATNATLLRGHPAPLREPFFGCPLGAGGAGERQGQTVFV